MYHRHRAGFLPVPETRLRRPRDALDPTQIGGSRFLERQETVKAAKNSRAIAHGKRAP